MLVTVGGLAPLKRERTMLVRVGGLAPLKRERTMLASAKAGP
jgi:hypothetical protein